MSQLITNGQQTLNAIEAERASWSRSFVDASAALTDLNAAFGSAVPNIRDLLNVAPGLLGRLQTESGILAQLGSHVTNDNVLSILETGITHGPTASGGALEVFPDGRRLPIFRVCLLGPPQPNPSSGGTSNSSCTGQVFPQPGSEPVPNQPASADGIGAGSITALAGLIGA